MLSQWLSSLIPAACCRAIVEPPGGTLVRPLPSAIFHACIQCSGVDGLGLWFPSLEFPWWKQGEPEGREQTCPGRLASISALSLLTATVAPPPAHFDNFSDFPTVCTCVGAAALSGFPVERWSVPGCRPVSLWSSVPEPACF